MTQSTISHLHWGVSCPHCCRFISLYAEELSQESVRVTPEEALGLANPGIFLMRCDRCGSECPFLTSDIEQREGGEPGVNFKPHQAFQNAMQRKTKSAASGG